MMDYRAIKDYAKQNRCSVKDLLVLAPQNDPFYAGTGGDKILAEWFSDLWNRFGYTTGVHLRRIHYRLTTLPTPVLMPNGLPYENTKNCTVVLDHASKCARYLGLLDPGAFIDMKNDEPIVNIRSREEETEVFIYGGDASSLDFSFPAIPEIPYYSIEGFEGEQRYHLEVWIEKSTMNDILIPICRRFEATFVYGKGELSITRVSEIMDRLRKYKRPCRIFYISDFDPGGQSMPVAVARKIEYFLSRNGLEADVKLFHLGLTEEQCRRYRLPRTPIKGKERRAARFEERFGEGATELDALEALHPGEIGKILSDALGSYFDDNLPDQVESVKEDHQGELDKRRDGVLARHQHKIDRLRKEHESLREEFEKRMSDIRDRTASLWQTIGDELVEKSFNVGIDDIPEAAEAGEIGEGLYNSGRDYLKQLAVYKEFQGKLKRMVEIAGGAR